MTVAISCGHSPTSLRNDHTPSLTDSESASEEWWMWWAVWRRRLTVSVLGRRQGGRGGESHSHIELSKSCVFSCKWKYPHRKPSRIVGSPMPVLPLTKLRRKRSPAGLTHREGSPQTFPAIRIKTFAKHSNASLCENIFLQMRLAGVHGTLKPILSPKVLNNVLPTLYIRESYTLPL